MRLLKTFHAFLEMIRFSHTLFALPFAMLAAVMAWTVKADPPVMFETWHLIGILLAMVGARSAAMAFNRLVDANIDASNPRTASRHLPTGILSRGTVIIFMLISVAVFLLGASLFLPNFLPLLLAGPVLVVLLGYSYAKRFTSFSHFWLGLALGLAPVCAWVAIRGNAVIADQSDLLPALILGLAVMFWVAGFDMIYACQDFEFDRAAGLNSMPAAIGMRYALRLAGICHAIMIVFLVLLPIAYQWSGPDLGFGWLYGVGVAAIAGLLVFEHRMVRPDDLSRVNAAFFNVNAVISIGLFVIGVIDLTVM
jgi:4-hydroxybenzoate polyprenyltransferase